MGQTDVDLGFVEEPDDAAKLLSHFFPSKVGGKPAWLHLSELPDIDRIRCGSCGKPCVFLLQLYAPTEDKPDSFHRTIFIFICKEAGCSKKNDAKNFVILRSQLPRSNKFYSDIPPEDIYVDDRIPFPKAEDYSPLCMVCGCLGGKKCGKCRKASYCSKEHQVLHWQSGHKEGCTTGLNSSEMGNDNLRLLFPEYELAMEAEDLHEGGCCGKDHAPVLKEKHSQAEICSGGPPSDPNFCSEEVLKDLDAMASNLEDKMFSKFKTRILHDPEQVIRYDRGGQPLWVSSQHVPSDEDIPPCACGAKREFEFQVMPQLLCSLDVDSLSTSIDWGTLAIFTCSQDCTRSTYVEEYLWKQDFNDKV